MVAQRRLVVLGSIALPLESLVVGTLGLVEIAAAQRFLRASALVRVEAKHRLEKSDALVRLMREEVPQIL